MPLLGTSLEGGIVGSPGGCEAKFDGLEDKGVVSSLGTPLEGGLFESPGVCEAEARVPELGSPLSGALVALEGLVELSSLPEAEGLGPAAISVGAPKIGPLLGEGPEPVNGVSVTGASELAGRIAFGVGLAEPTDSESPTGGMVELEVVLTTAESLEIGASTLGGLVPGIVLSVPVPPGRLFEPAGIFEFVGGSTGAVGFKPTSAGSIEFDGLADGSLATGVVDPVTLGLGSKEPELDGRGMSDPRGVLDSGRPSAPDPVGGALSRVEFVGVQGSPFCRLPCFLPGLHAHLSLVSTSGGSADAVLLAEGLLVAVA